MRGLKIILMAFCLTGLVACAQPRAIDEINDPYEAQNRKIHEFNKVVDQAVLKPAAQTYSDVVPDPVEDAVSNFANNLGMPSNVLNHLAQGELGYAIESTGIFLVNSTVGLGGLADVAGWNGQYAHATDFGETLQKWGLGEGVYVELPLLGPSTERAALGKVLDSVTNPLSRLTVAQEGIVTAAKIGEILSDRVEYGDVVDQILYQSADSYSQTRLFYLQSRRSQLGYQFEAEDALFEELYGSE
jgi:phospholipid-binding lipoprotein MlaA